MVVFNKESHILPLLLTALLSSLVIAFHEPPAQPKQATTNPLASLASGDATTIASVPKSEPEPIRFDANEPSTWPKCADNEWVWADDGQCHKKIVSRAMAHGGNCEQWRPMIAKYDWNVEIALAVCSAESSGRADNDNPGDRHPSAGPLVCWGSRGLFQIGCDSVDNYSAMFDPAANIGHAYGMYAARGWQPWSYVTCKYKVACY